ENRSDTGGCTVNDALDTPLLFAADGNDESAIANRDKLFLQLRSVGWAMHDGLELVRQARPGNCEGSAYSGQLRAVILIDLTVVNGTPEVFTQLTQIRQSLAGLDK